MENNNKYKRMVESYLFKHRNQKYVQTLINTFKNIELKKQLEINNAAKSYILTEGGKD